MDPSSISPEVALNVGLLAGFFALIVHVVWPSSHYCHDLTCRRLRRERKLDKPPEPPGPPTIRHDPDQMGGL